MRGWWLGEASGTVGDHVTVKVGAFLATTPVIRVSKGKKHKS